MQLVNFQRVMVDMPGEDHDSEAFRELKKYSSGNYERAGDERRLEFLKCIRSANTDTLRVHRYGYYFRDNGKTTPYACFILEYAASSDLVRGSEVLISSINKFFNPGSSPGDKCIKCVIVESNKVDKVTLNRDIENMRHREQPVEQLKKVNNENCCIVY